jgi:hypothetical protein
VAVHASPHDRLLYPVPVLCQLALTGALAHGLNPYEQPPVKTMAMQGSSKHSNVQHLYPMRVARMRRQLEAQFLPGALDSQEGWEQAAECSDPPTVPLNLSLLDRPNRDNAS